MTDTSHRTYAVAIALVVFFLSWAAIAADPWATPKPDPRLVALQAREQRLRVDAKVVARVVAARSAAYQTALQARRAAIAEARARPIPVAQPPQVRIVTLPPLTVTRSS
jgi:hypothetical protein